MRKYPEVFALLFLALAWGVASNVMPTRAEANRVMVLTTPDYAAVESIEDCAVNKLRRIPLEMRQRIETDVRDRMHEEIRSAVRELKESLRSF